ncbi:MAG: 4Fe-4S dicluster domain-containing protein [Actinomycetia bacterium]|nr:4Fe-4S dicluster domain-containing protein [Actinomycetes bacterium]
MPQYGFYFDSSRCTGCKTCELACKDYKDLGPGIALRVVYDYEGGEFKASGSAYSQNVFSYHVSKACNHCELPACSAGCPSGAISKDDNGLVYIDPETCIGARNCVSACPYSTPKFDEEAKKGVKCDGCRLRVEAGLKPICVEACPLRVLEFDTIDSLRAKYGDTASIAPLADPSKTKPNLVVKMAPAAKPAGDSTGFVANPTEVQ